MGRGRVRCGAFDRHPRGSGLLVGRRGGGNRGEARGRQSLGSQPRGDPHVLGGNKMNGGKDKGRSQAEAKSKHKKSPDHNPAHNVGELHDLFSTCLLWGKKIRHLMSASGGKGSIQQKKNGTKTPQMLSKNKNVSATPTPSSILVQ